MLTFRLLMLINTIDLFLNYFKTNFFIFYKMDPSNKSQKIEDKKEHNPKAKYQRVEGSKIYKTRKYVQSDRAKQNAEARRLRDQYLIDHKEEILKLDVKGRVKKVVEMLKQDLNLNISYKTLYPLLNKYVITDITNQRTEERKLRDQYLIDHKEEILKLEPRNRIKKVQELLKKDLNIDVNYNKMYTAFNKFNL